MSIASKLTRTLAGILAGAFLLSGTANATCPSNNCHTPNKGKKPDLLDGPTKKKDWHCIKLPSGIDANGGVTYITSCQYY